jgi:clan AA aspartic protease (TIGR02281 family)
MMINGDTRRADKNLDMTSKIIAAALAVALSACAATPMPTPPSQYNATATPPSPHHATATPPSPHHATAPPFTTDEAANMLDQAVSLAENGCQQGNIIHCALVSEIFTASEACHQGDSVDCQRGLIAMASKMCKLGMAGTCRNAAVIAQLPPPKSSAPVAVASSATTAHVPLTRTPGGSLTVAASINGSAPIRFTLDSGAEALVLPSSMARPLVQQGTITQAEFLGNGVSELANGSQTRDLRFRLRSVNIGGIVVQNVTCVVFNGDGNALLGQAVLSKLRAWKIDNARQTLDIS